MLRPHLKGYALFFIWAVTMTAACKQSGKVRDMDANSFSEQLKKDSNALVIDVRTAEEFEQGHLKGAINYNVEAGDFEQKISSLDTSKALYVYCLAGKRSAKAASILDEKGYRRIYNLSGGIKQWEEQGLPLTHKP